MGPGGQMGGMGGIDMGMLQQYLQSMQGPQAQMGMQGPGGMQIAMPDQGSQQLPPGVLETMRGQGMPMPKPNLGGGSPPFMPPGWGGGQMGGMQGQDMRGVMPRPGMPQAPQQAIRQPPAPRMPPGAGVYQNPLTKQMMNQTPIFSGQNNPNAAGPDKPGGAMTPAGPASDVSPVKAPPGGTASATPTTDAPMTYNKPGKVMGAPPFNPTQNSFAASTDRRPQSTDRAKKAEMTTKKYASK
jgi:hypothetical protein